MRILGFHHILHGKCTYHPKIKKKKDQYVYIRYKKKNRKRKLHIRSENKVEFHSSNEFICSCLIFMLLGVSRAMISSLRLSTWVEETRTWVRGRSLVWWWVCTKKELEVLMIFFKLQSRKRRRWCSVQKNWSHGEIRRERDRWCLLKVKNKAKGLINRGKGSKEDWDWERGVQGWGLKAIHVTSCHPNKQVKRTNQKEVRNATTRPQYDKNPICNKKISTLLAHTSSNSINMYRSVYAVLLLHWGWSNLHITCSPSSPQSLIQSHQCTTY